MKTKEFVIIAAIALCYLLDEVHAKLKCVQCGMSPNRIIEIRSKTKTLQELVNKNRDMYICPKDLPAPTECKSENHKYCVKLFQNDMSVRFCSKNKIERCRGRTCANSCNTDGCNGEFDSTITAFKLEVYPKLKCVQCGISPNQLLQMVRTNRSDLTKLEEDLQKNPGKYICPRKLPKPTECDREDHRYCVKSIQNGTSVRFCSVINLEGCKGGSCVHSCNTNGCNSEKTGRSDLINVRGKLKCVQCGIPSTQLLKRARTNRPDLRKAQEYLENILGNVICPTELPEATECDSKDQRYCVKSVQNGTSVRFCSVINLEGCKGGSCVHSCTTDGCNGEKSISIKTSGIDHFPQKLKCIQCGTPSNQLVKMAKTDRPDLKKLKQDVEKNSKNYICPSHLPEPRECDSKDQRYCVISTQHGSSVRFCSVIKLEWCKGGYCVHSCNTDGCNGEKIINRDIASSRIIGKLRCIQCGLSPVELARMLKKNPQQAAKLKEDIKKNNRKYSCPSDLPEPTECGSKNHQYCIKMVHSDHSSRFCSVTKLDLCISGGCVHSCDTNGCND